jgi:ubiquinone/menaquinone biosynthesis C-methylase UbiE
MRRMASPASVALVLAMWWYSAVVLHPAQLARRATPPPNGLAWRQRGLGARFSTGQQRRIPLQRPSPNADLVAEFDRMAKTYERYVVPFTAPVWRRALRLMRAHVPPDARVLDVGCGPGVELRDAARLVPRGEVVGVDLAAEMLGVAASEADRRGITNVAFVQADVCALPAELDGSFDVAYACFSQHHFPDPLVASREVLRTLAPGGVYCVIDVGREWLRRLATPIARLGDPGWIGFATPERTAAMLVEAGAHEVAVSPLLPGIDMVLARTAPH